MVRSLGPGASGVAEGDEVVILPSLGWGGGEAAPEPGFRILGGPDDGTYAELIAIPAANVFPRPARLSWEESAALPLAGLTAYRALVSRAGVRPGETVLVIGIGGGVATIALHIARSAGCRVIVTSSSPEKLDRAARARRRRGRGLHGGRLAGGREGAERRGRGRRRRQLGRARPGPTASPACAPAAGSWPSAGPAAGRSS